MRAVGILVQAPIPGRVKTRLSDDVGPSAAAEVYWRVGRQVVGATVGAGYRCIVWYRPAGEGPFVNEWLEGLGRFELRPQAHGTLGQRVNAAFARMFADGAPTAVLVGSDCPGVDRRVVTEAFTALGAADVVMGPTLDGGYYLLALRPPALALLAGPDWRTGTLAAQARARAAALGLRMRQLRPLRDVDTARDARLLGLLKA